MALSKILLKYGEADSEIDRLPEKSAVYAFYSVPQNKNGKYFCKYVGQTNNLNRRTKEHYSDEEQNEDLKGFLSEKQTVLLYEICKSSELNKKEAEWIDELSPEFNKTSPEV